MAVNYVEKGIGLWQAIRAAGFQKFMGVNGIYYVDPDHPTDTSQDAAVQAIINSYDPLPLYKSDAVVGIKATALAKMQTLFPAIIDINMVLLIAELWKSIAAAARSPTANWTTLINIYTAAVGGIANVNAATTQAGVDAAVAAIVWPI